MKIDASTLASRAQAAQESLHACHLCARHCAVNRLAGERGYCDMDARVRCFRDMLHDAEETPLNPSHQIYFSGCNLRCEFCSVLEWIEAPQAAPLLDMAHLQDAIEQRRDQGARTLNLLGGEPTVSIHGILALLARIDPHTRVVWNSNMYYSEVTGQWLAGAVDLFLADLKCGNPECAEHLLGAADYCEVTRRNIRAAAQQGDMIIRHVLLPGHWDCCFIPTLRWIAEQVPSVPVSLRMDYVPPARARFAPLSYTIPAEQQAAQEMLEQFNLKTIS